MDNGQYQHQVRLSYDILDELGLSKDKPYGSIWEGHCEAKRWLAENCSSPYGWDTTCIIGTNEAFVAYSFDDVREAIQFKLTFGGV
jgi:hypothetical protein